MVATAPPHRQLRRRSALRHDAGRHAQDHVRRPERPCGRPQRPVRHRRLHLRVRHHRPVDGSAPGRRRTNRAARPASSTPGPFGTGQFDTGAFAHPRLRRPGATGTGTFDTGAFDTTGQWDASAWTQAQDTGQYDNSAFAVRLRHHRPVDRARHALRHRHVRRDRMERDGHHDDRRSPSAVTPEPDPEPEPQLAYETAEFASPGARGRGRVRVRVRTGVRTRARSPTLPAPTFSMRRARRPRGSRAEARRGAGAAGGVAPPSVRRC